MASLTSIGASILAFVVLDGVWLGLVMKDFYRTQLMPIGRMVDGSITPVWSIAALVYVLLGLGVAVFVVHVPPASLARRRWGRSSAWSCTASTT